MNILNKRISDKEIQELYKKYQTPQRVTAHCRAVAKVAQGIAAELNKHGYDLDTDLVRSTSLVHDVARTWEDHALKGYEILHEMGYEDEAQIVKVHMTYPSFNPTDKLNECDIVCLADRLVREDRYVGLDRRIEYIIQKAKSGPNAEEHIKLILESKEKTGHLMDEIAAVTGISIDHMFDVSAKIKDRLDGILRQVEKPGRYVGGEINSVIKKDDEVRERFVFAFPDMYEIGMSYLGMQILYDAVNKREGLYCERVFAPAGDMKELMEKYDIPLFTLETKKPLKDADMIGFTLQYEMSYTTVLDMLQMAGIAVQSKDRTDEDPVIAAGGPCAFNPEPLADFIDLFLIGDGEDLLPEILKLHERCREAGLNKTQFLEKACKIGGVYVPAFYEPEYNKDGTIKKICKLNTEAPDVVRRHIIPDIEEADFPVKPIIPLIEAVHDRSVVETFRGCTRGCRFCQAGMIYRPVRERSKEKIMELAEKQIKNTGNDELSLLSLSTSDHSKFRELTLDLMEECRKANVSLSLPSLRIDNFAFEVLNKIQEYKKSGLTYAPEAGTQRLRNVINKGVTEDDIFTSVEQAIVLGWRRIKLYFMIGLPTETTADLDGIADIASKIIEINKKYNGPKGGAFRLTVSVSNFVPKADTPFQWEGQNTPEQFMEKHDYLENKLKIKGVTFNFHDSFTSVCEAVLARGDRRCGQALLAAHRLGCRLDGWGEYFSDERWKRAFEESNISPDFYAYRRRDEDEILPWDHIDCGVAKGFFLREKSNAYGQRVTPDCRIHCNGCGINQITECKLEGIYG